MEESAQSKGRNLVPRRSLFKIAGLSILSLLKERYTRERDHNFSSVLSDQIVREVVGNQNNLRYVDSNSLQANPYLSNNTEAVDLLKNRYGIEIDDPKNCWISWIPEFRNEISALSEAGVAGLNISTVPQREILGVSSPDSHHVILVSEKGYTLQFNQSDLIGNDSLASNGLQVYKGGVIELFPQNDEGVSRKIMRFNGVSTFTTLFEEQYYSFGASSNFFEASLKNGRDSAMFITTNDNQYIKIDVDKKTVTLYKEGEDIVNGLEDLDPMMNVYGIPTIFTKDDHVGYFKSKDEPDRVSGTKLSFEVISAENGASDLELEVNKQKLKEAISRNFVQLIPISSHLEFYFRKDIKVTGIINIVDMANNYLPWIVIGTDSNNKVVIIEDKITVQHINRMSLPEAGHWIEEGNT